MPRPPSEDVVRRTEKPPFAMPGEIPEPKPKLPGRATVRARQQKKEELISQYPEARYLSDKAIAFVLALEPYRPSNVIKFPGGYIKRDELINYLRSAEGAIWFEKTVTPQWITSYIAPALIEPRYFTGETVRAGPQPGAYRETRQVPNLYFYRGLGSLAGNIYNATGRQMPRWGGGQATTGVAPAGGAPIGAAPTAPAEGYRPTWYQFLSEQQQSPMRQQWMEGLFPELVRRYEAGFPPMKEEPAEGETTWASYLKQYPFGQEWGRLPYWQRGEQPSRYQPAIKTVGF